jgi:hypothetical protein
VAATAIGNDPFKEFDNMVHGKSAGHTTTQSSVEVTSYLREVLSQADASGLAVVETRLEETFSGGLVARGWATHLRLEHADGRQTLMCIERITGHLDGRSGSFVLEANGFSDRQSIVHGRWEIVANSGTEELTGLRGYAAFVARPDKASRTGWSAQTTLTYWFEETAP